MNAVGYLCCCCLGGTPKALAAKPIRTLDQVKFDWAAAEKEYNEANCCNKYFNCCRRSRYSVARTEYDYAMIKDQFTTQHHHLKIEKLPDFVMNNDFPFFTYLRKCVRTVGIALCTVHWQVWLVLLLLIFLNAIRYLPFVFLHPCSSF
jgi:hypothetical protein